MVIALLAVFLLLPDQGFAIFPQTASDLLVLEDSIRSRIEEEKDFKGKLTPMLLAPPRHLWTDSRNDFAQGVMETLTKVLDSEQSIIPCIDCDTHRLHVRDDNSLQVNNGELSFSDLILLRKDPRYQNAKTYALVEETASGVSMRVTSLTDGRVVFFALADSKKDLEEAQPYLHLSREYERRRREESLAYVFINLGLYPNPLVQVEWVEQWGKYNEHLTGLAISLVSPTVALGATYHWMLPGLRRANIGLAAFYPLQNLVDTGDSQDLTTKIVFQIMAQYAFSTTFGMFVSGSTEGNIALGINLFNPILMPVFL